MVGAYGACQTAVSSSILLLSGVLDIGESCHTEYVVAYVELWASHIKPERWC